MRHSQKAFNDSNKKTNDKKNNLMLYTTSDKRLGLVVPRLAILQLVVLLLEELLQSRIAFKSLLKSFKSFKFV